ncbi:MAG: ATP-binding cassette domain-containing protein, partial [Cypionkella sp.]
MTSAVLRRIAPARAVPTTLHPAYALALSRISLSFGGIYALREVSFQVAPGEIRAVIGPNGAGKSSVLNVISGLYQADSGSLVLGSRVFEDVPPQALAGFGVARTFQNLALFPSLSVAANIAAGLTFQRKAWAISQVFRLPNARAENRTIADQVAEIAARLDLTTHLDRTVSTLSYGLQKRVELARAL